MVRALERGSASSGVTADDWTMIDEMTDEDTAQAHSPHT